MYLFHFFEIFYFHTEEFQCDRTLAHARAHPTSQLQYEFDGEKKAKQNWKEST